jgi:hypothetical protein
MALLLLRRRLPVADGEIDTASVTQRAAIAGPEGFWRLPDGSGLPSLRDIDWHEPAVVVPVPVVHSGPLPATIGPMVNVELERVEALELLGIVMAHLNDAEARREMSARVPMLMGIRDKLAASLREEQ